MPDTGHDIAADILADFFQIVIQVNIPPYLIKRLNQMHDNPPHILCQYVFCTKNNDRNLHSEGLTFWGWTLMIIKGVN